MRWSGLCPELERPWMASNRRRAGSTGARCGASSPEGALMSESGVAADALVVQVLLGPADDAEELDQLTSRLQDELIELDVAAVEPVPADAPERTKGVSTDVAGLFSVFLGSAGLSSVVNAVAAWAKQNKRSVELTFGGDTLKLDGATKEQTDRAIDEWVARRPARP